MANDIRGKPVDSLKVAENATLVRPLSMLHT
jgi:hypothetical protein